MTAPCRRDWCSMSGHAPVVPAANNTPTQLSNRSSRAVSPPNFCAHVALKRFPPQRTKSFGTPVLHWGIMAENANIMTAPVKPWPVAVLAGWVVPGAGHLLMRRPGRGILVFVSVLVMFLLGLMMRGPLFQPMGGDLLTTIIYYGGFIAHITTGAPYFLAVALGYSQADIAGHVHDYGSKFLVAAGLLNVLAMVDAYEIAKGRKS